MPERVTSENVLFVVGDHERRLTRLETKTEDLDVVKHEVKRCADHVHNLRSDIAGVSKTLGEFASKADVDGLRKALYTFALSVAASALIFALTLFAVLK